MKYGTPSCAKNVTSVAGRVQIHVLIKNMDDTLSIPNHVIKEESMTCIPYSRTIYIGLSHLHCKNMEIDRKQVAMGASKCRMCDKITI